MRKDVLALSSCSKDLRRLAFDGALLNEVTVKLNGKELSELASMSEDLSQLIIKPGRAGEVEESYPDDFSFQDFIRLFPNLKTVFVYWTVYPEGTPHFNMLPSCEQHTQALSKDGLAHIPPTLTEIRIRAVYRQWYYDDRPEDALNHNQVRCLVRQLQFPSVQSIAFSFCASSLLNAMDRHSILPAIIEACNEYHISNLKEASLQINSVQNGSTTEVDICDMFSIICRTCWIGNNLKRMSVRLLIGGYAAEPSEDFEYDEVIDCPASPPPIPRLTELATIIKTVRPELDKVFLFVQCSLRTKSYRKPFGMKSYRKPLGIAEWLLEYPPSAPARPVTECQTSSDDSKLASIVLLSIDGEVVAMFTAADEHPKFACCLAIREQEADWAHRIACKARAEAAAEAREVMLDPNWEMGDLSESDIEY